MGALIAGTPDDVAAQADKVHAPGASHLVFDLRQRFDDWLECVELLGEEVLPRLRRAVVR